MQKGIILHKGQRYLKLATDGYIYPYAEALAKQKNMVEIFPFEEDPPEEIVKIKREEEDLLPKLNEMTKRQINEFAKLEKTDREIQLTGKPNMVDQAMKKLTWR
jgi:hypothetical protein